MFKFLFLLSFFVISSYANVINGIYVYANFPAAAAQGVVHPSLNYQGASFTNSVPSSGAGNYYYAYSNRFECYGQFFGSFVNGRADSPVASAWCFDKQGFGYYIYPNSYWVNKTYFQVGSYDVGTVEVGFINNDGANGLTSRAIVNYISGYADEGSLPEFFPPQYNCNFPNGVQGFTDYTYYGELNQASCSALVGSFVDTRKIVAAKAFINNTNGAEQYDQCKDSPQCYVKTVNNCTSCSIAFDAVSSQCSSRGGVLDEFVCSDTTGCVDLDAFSFSCSYPETIPPPPVNEDGTFNDNYINNEEQKQDIQQLVENTEPPSFSHDTTQQYSDNKTNAVNNSGSLVKTDSTTELDSLNNLSGQVGDVGKNISKIAENSEKESDLIDNVLDYSQDNTTNSVASIFSSIPDKFGNAFKVDAPVSSSGFQFAFDLYGEHYVLFSYDMITDILNPYIEYIRAISYLLAAFFGLSPLIGRSQ